MRGRNWVYFIPRNNRFYAFFIARSRWQWGCGTLALAASVAVAWWVVCVIPLQRHVLRAQHEYDALVVRQSALAQLSHEISSLESQVTLLQTELRQSVGSGGASYKRLLNSLLVHVVECGLSLENCSLKVPERKQWCTIHPIELQLSGSFAQLAGLFQQVGLQEGAIFLRNLTVLRTADTKLSAVLVFDLLEVGNA
jgi:Tfp pilus assembly protein PilO